MNNALLGLLRRKEWLLRDRFERAVAANKAANMIGPGMPVCIVSPLSQNEMERLELDMLTAQIELAREESTPETTETT